MQCNATLKNKDDMVQAEGGREYREAQVICMTAPASSSWVGGWYEVERLVPDRPPADATRDFS